MKRLWELIRFDRSRYQSLGHQRTVMVLLRVPNRLVFFQKEKQFEERHEFRRFRLARVPTNRVNIIWTFIEGLARGQGDFLAAPHLQTPSGLLT
jgi:hypothetical protein